MTKEKKTLEQLRDMINSVIRNNVKLDAVTAGTPYMHEPDGQGANWDLSEWSGPAPLVETAKEEVRFKLREFRSRYIAVHESEGEDDEGDADDDWPNR